MTFNWTVDIGTIISAAAFLLASAGIFLSWHSHAVRMDVTMEAMQKELTGMQKQLEKLADLAVQAAVNDERFRNIERFMSSLRCVEGRCPTTQVD